MYLDNVIAPYLSTTQPIFEQMMALHGERFRHLEGRETQRITLGDKHYFIKQHMGVGWKEIIKNLLQLRWPVLGAKNEWQAIQKLTQLGIDVPKVLAYGQRGWNPATQQSFILMEELAPVVSLEDLTQQWKQAPPAFALKCWLIKEVARIARTLHQNGINHRDFYLCHFLWDERKKKLFIIDLHRAQLRNKTPMRWIIKDLAGLYFSSKDSGLSRRDQFRFMKVYAAKPLRDIIGEDSEFWLKVKGRGEQLYCDLNT